jgi:hypothetical protein
MGVKKLIVYCLILFSTNCFAEVPSISRVRSLFEQAHVQKSSCIKLIKLLDPYNEINFPILMGYKACGTIIMAKHVPNPFSKLSYFRKGKKMLETVIAVNDKVVELRFLRYSIQTNAPSFLGYNNHIAEDKMFLEKALPFLNDTVLRNKIYAYLRKYN